MADLIKCVVWDLDGTVWEGTLVEGDTLVLQAEIVRVLQELGRRGIVNCIASRNTEQAALDQLQKFQIAQHFVVCKINREPKPDNIRAIAQQLNIGLEAIAFIDDNPFEREDVKFSLPAVHVIEAGRYDEILDMPAFQPSAVTVESQQRAQFYQTDAIRKQAEQSFAGSRIEFLKSCEMRLDLRYAQTADIPRIVELAARTNQINTTGIRYSSDEIQSLLSDATYQVLVCELVDRFGEYGTIGAIISHKNSAAYSVENLMVSCRADGRGIPSALLIVAMRKAKAAGVILEAKYLRTERNAQLGILYQMMGFQRQLDQTPEAMTVWFHDSRTQAIPEMPAWLMVTTSFDVLG